MCDLFSKLIILEMEALNGILTPEMGFPVYALSISATQERRTIKRKTRRTRIFSRSIISAQRALNVILTPEMGSPHQRALAVKPCQLF